MNKKKRYLITSIIVFIILIISGVFTKINNAKDNTFTTEKLNFNSSVYKKINNIVSVVIDKNRTYLLNIGEDVTYLILDGSYLNFKNETSYFSDVKIENKGDSILIYFSEELKTYSEGKNSENRLIYKITKDNDTEYIKVFKNGEETHIDSVIGA